MAKKSTKDTFDDADLRSSLLSGGFEAEDYENAAVGRGEVSEGRLFGLNAVERMILSIVLFLAVTIIGIALLFITGTVAIR